MKGRKLLQLALILVFLVSTVLLLGQWKDNAGGSESYDTALAIATANKKTAPATAETEETVSGEPQWVPEAVTDDPVMEELAAIDLEALRQVNPDVIGWIRIPGSNIDYPILQGEDNEYYLKHTWEGKENSVGSVFLEHRNNPDFTEFNTILYAHNMNDGSMFANIKRYETKWYWEQHPYVYIVLDSGVYRYAVFSSYQAKVESSTYGLSFEQQKTRATFLAEALKNSRVKSELRPTLTDRVLTLSTCSGMGYSNRWVVHAYLKMVEVK